jgi:very-short-patch-repair endonuclease
MKHQVVIELDGSQHNFDAHAARDMCRDDKLARNGFRVLRFWNSDIDRNLTGVLEAIDRALAEVYPTRPPSAATLPLRGRDS